jgi:hypothetical protein
MEQWIFSGISAAIGVVALVTSVTSLYLSNFRRGRLVMARPTSVAIIDSLAYLDHDGLRPSGKAAQMFRIPISMTNSGAQAVVVEEMRLRVRGPRGIELEAMHGQWKETLAVQKTEGEVVGAGDFARPFVVAPRAVFERVGVFKSVTDRPLLAVGDYVVHVEASIVGRRTEWRELTAFRFAINPSRLNKLQDGGEFVRTATAAL